MGVHTRGKFITFEGGEGSGKSTQVALLAEWLQTNGIQSVATREPGGSPSAEAIRHLLVEGPTDRWQPVSEVLLHNAARAEHLANLVLPTLDGGDWVVSDRYLDSTMAYQGYAHGFDRQVIVRIHQEATGGVMPDLTLVLDVPVAEGLERAGTRPGNEDRYERMGSEFHERVRRGFLKIADQAPDRCIVIDAAQSQDDVFKSVAGAVMSRLLNDTKP